ncbi:MAG: CotH kinase family protein [Clostridia bacterium]|nr:CotH kinase family protein [Clostridia bacterium]
MKKLRIVMEIAALAAVLAAAVLLGSPYAPVVQPVREIEEIWAIEDARQESETPLVTRLENNGIPLAYDAYKNTFYCALGLDNADEWPQIHLTAPGAKDVEICFVDDYSYDWCQDAVRDGYEYQIIACNDDVYSYAQIVFTGLPILQLRTQEKIPEHVDTPAQVSWSYDADSGVQSHGRAHERGGWTLLYNEMKHGLRVEFTRRADGTGKVEMPLEGMGMTSDLVLIPCLSDVMLIRERLCWDLYDRIRGKDEPFGGREISYTELFINDEYQGIYLAVKPFDYEQELRMAGREALQTDSIYRSLSMMDVEENERPLYDENAGWTFELRYSAKPAGRQFDAFEPFAQLFEASQAETEEADALLEAAFSELMDIDRFLEYALYVQACGLRDNIHNNMYVWARLTEGRYRYELFPWDLDYSFDAYFENYEDVKWILTPLLDRLLEIDCGGVMRQRTLEKWTQLRDEVFNDAVVEELMAKYMRELEESGAFARDVERWNKPVAYPDGFATADCASLRFEMLDERFAEIADESLSGVKLEIGESETTAAEEPTP